MSIKRMVAVWDHSQQSGPALLLLLAIADYADENGLAWPGMTRLAQKARLDRSNGWHAVNKLCQSGELLALSRARQRSNMYVVTLGLTMDQLHASFERARELGATNIRGRAGFTLPPEVEKVLSGRGGDTPPDDGGSVTAPLEVGAERHQVVSQRTQGSVTAHPDPSLSVIDPSVIRQWGVILEELRATVPKETYRQYYHGSEIVAVNDGTWVVQVAGAHAAEWLDKRLRPMVEHRMERHAPGVSVEFIAREGAT